MKENPTITVPHEAGNSSTRTWNWFDYHSVFSYRYGSQPMRRIWSEGHKAELSADVWISAARGQNKAGLVTAEEVHDLEEHRINFIRNIDEVLSREMNDKNPRYSGHDVVSGISVYGDFAKIGGRILHRPFTSEDLLSNVEVLQMIEALNIVDMKLRKVLEVFAPKIDQYKDLPALGQTHMQAAEPLTFGLRLAVLCQDFLRDYQALQFLKTRIYGKGIKGPVGTMAEIHRLLQGTGVTAFDYEDGVMDELGLQAFPVTGQTYPRKLTAEVIGCLADIGVSAKRFGMNMRLYQSSLFDELAEPRNSRDVGSSAMPHKRNPRHAENIMALARGLKFKHAEAQEVAEEVPMERGLDDSAGKRSFLPEAFLATDEVLSRTARIVNGLVVHENSLYRNLHNFAQFVSTSPILTILTDEGANREYMHNKLFGLATQAYENLQSTGINNFGELVLTDPELKQFAIYPELGRIIDEPETHIDPAPQLCERFLKEELLPILNG